MGKSKNMSKGISQDELKHKIVTSIRREGLDGIFGEETIEKIRERVTQEYRLQQEAPLEPQEEQLQETDMRPPVSGGPSQFPYEDDFVSSGAIQDAEVEAEPVGIEPGAAATDVPYEPVRAMAPEVPQPLKDQQPGEIIVFDYNEVAAVSGENLANKPFRKKDDPESKQTIHDFWMQEGKTKVKVYAAKFEEIGEVEFDYQNGTAHFTDLKNPPVSDTVNTYQENPYAAQSLPQVDEPQTETDLRKTLESQVDVEAVLMKVMKDILKDGLQNLDTSVEPTIPTPAPIANPVQERLSLDDVKQLAAVEVPEAINQRLLGESAAGVEYVSQSNEYAAYLMEGKMYYVINGDETKAYTALESDS